MRRGVVGSVTFAAALGLPGSALAHGGPSAPIATNFDARIAGLTPASPWLKAKTVDGDRVLWLKAAPGTTVVVPGALGEPLLRFGHRGVFVNLHSVTAQSDRIDRFDLRPLADPAAAPRWHRLTTGHVYAWHEHRLHALEPLARGRSSAGTLGRWSVPLLVDGRRHRLTGVLVFTPPGSPWPWIVPSAVVASALVFAGRAPSRRTGVAVTSALPAAALVWLLRVARELYGRPTVGLSALALVAATCAVGVALAWGLLHRDAGVRVFAALLAGAGALYQAATMLPVLTHARALTVLPSTLIRFAVAAALALGAAAIVLSAAALALDRTDDPALDRALGGAA
jgi:hypothetical protein